MFQTMGEKIHEHTLGHMAGQEGWGQIVNDREGSSGVWESHTWTPSLDPSG